MFNAVGQRIAHHSEHQDRSAHVLHPDVGDPSGSLGRKALSTGHEPNLILPQSNSSDKLHLLWCLKMMFLRRHGKTQEQCNEQPKDEEYMEKFQYHCKFFPTILKTLIIEPEILGGIKVTTPCSTSRNNSSMPFQNINEQLVHKSNYQQLLPRDGQQRK